MTEARRLGHDNNLALPDGFKPDNKAHVREVLNLLLCTPTDTPMKARRWFELFCLASDHLSDHQTQLEIDLSCEPDCETSKMRIKAYEEDILSLLLSQREALMRRYLESPYQLAMHEDDRGRIRSDFMARIKHSSEDLATLQISENALVRDYRSFLHGARAPLFDKLTPLSVIVGRQSDRTEAIRKRAFLAYWSFVEEHEQTYKSFFERLAQNRNEQTRIAGSSNFEAFVYTDLGRLDFTPENCTRLRGHIRKHIVPLIGRLAKKQALDQDDPSENGRIKPWNSRTWQRHFPPSLPADGNPDRFRQSLGEACHALHPTLGKCFDTLMASGSLDIFPRAGKGSGAFCALRPLSGIPFVFGNFSISTKDLFTLFHELGHAAHGFCSAPIKNSLLRSPGLEFCEFVSTTFEFLSHDVLSHFWEDSAHAQMAMRFHLFHSLSFLPFAAQMDEFQSRVYADPKNACEIWSELGEEYRPQIDWTGHDIARRMGWCSRSHIYSSPFYYIDYAIAQISAWQIYAKTRPNKAQGTRQSTLRDFFSSLSLGGQRSSPELFQAAGVRNPFEEDTVIEVAALIEEICESL